MWAFTYRISEFVYLGKSVYLLLFTCYTNVWAPSVSVHTKKAHTSVGPNFENCKSIQSINQTHLAHAQQIQRQTVIINVAVRIINPFNSTNCILSMPTSDSNTAIKTTFHRWIIAIFFAIVKILIAFYLPLGMLATLSTVFLVANITQLNIVVVVVGVLRSVRITATHSIITLATDAHLPRRSRAPRLILLFAQSLEFQSHLEHVRGGHQRVRRLYIYV